MADYEMETFDGDSGAGDTHRTEIDDGKAQVSPGSQQWAGEHDRAEETRVDSAAEGRYQTDDGRAHTARQTVRHDPRSDSIRSVDIALPRLELVSHLSPIPSVLEIAPSGAGDPTESASHDAKTDDGRPHMLHQGTLPVPTGRPHISLCQV